MAPTTIQLITTAEKGSDGFKKESRIFHSSATLPNENVLISPVQPIPNQQTITVSRQPKIFQPNSFSNGIANLYLPRLLTVSWSTLSKLWATWVTYTLRDAPFSLTADSWATRPTVSIVIATCSQIPPQLLIAPLMLITNPLLPHPKIAQKCPPATHHASTEIYKLQQLQMLRTMILPRRVSQL